MIHLLRETKYEPKYKHTCWIPRRGPREKSLTSTLPDYWFNKTLQGVKIQLTRLHTEFNSIQIKNFSPSLKFPEDSVTSSTKGQRWEETEGPWLNTASVQSVSVWPWHEEQDQTKKRRRRLTTGHQHRSGSYFSPAVKSGIQETEAAANKCLSSFTTADASCVHTLHPRGGPWHRLSHKGSISLPLSISPPTPPLFSLSHPHTFSI